MHYEIDVADTTLGKDVYTLVQRRDVRGSSFAFQVEEENWRKEGDDEIR